MEDTEKAGMLWVLRKENQLAYIRVLTEAVAPN